MLSEVFSEHTAQQEPSLIINWQFFLISTFVMS